VNGAGENPAARRVDVIVGDVRGPGSDPANDRNPTTRIFARFTRDVLTRDRDRYAVQTVLSAADRDLYVQMRGTSTEVIKPRMDRTVAADATRASRTAHARLSATRHRRCLRH